MNRLLSQRLRNHRLFLLDDGEGGGSGGGTTVTDPPAPAGDPASTPPAGEGSGATAEPGAGKVTLTQDELDAHIKRAHAKGASAAEKKIGDYLTAESLSGEQKIAAERDAARTEAEQARAEAVQVRVEATAERAALTAKIDPARVDRFMKLVDLSDATVDGKPDGALIAAAVAKTLADFPEFAGTGTPAPAGSSGAEHKPSFDKIWTRAEIGKLSTAEFEKNEAEILAQTAQGLVK